MTPDDRKVHGAVKQDGSCPSEREESSNRSIDETTNRVSVIATVPR